MIYVQCYVNARNTVCLCACERERVCVCRIHCASIWRAKQLRHYYTPQHSIFKWPVPIESQLLETIRFSKFIRYSCLLEIPKCQKRHVKRQPS